MAPWKLPPKAKVYEALSAVADGRVRPQAGADSAEVVSSDGSRTYTVEWSADRLSFTANDNASYWQGYLGYPVIAVLLTLGEVRVGDGVADALAGVPWHDLNERFKRDYDAAVESVLAQVGDRGGGRERIAREVDGVMEQLADLKLERPGRGRRPPPRD